MERIDADRYFRGNLYSGQFIDYYYSGKKQGEGTFVNGKVEGRRILYYQNGNIQVEKYYLNGIENGLEKEYFEDGSLKQQKGIFLNGKEDGVWEMYFPNGRIKQRNRYNDETMEVETTRYNSTGKIVAVEVTKNGKTTPEKRFREIARAMSKGHKNNIEGDYKKSVKNYSKAIGLDAGNAEAYFARGTVKLNDLQFEEAILDFDKALEFEPYFEEALSNRAFARIRKYQFGSSRKLLENKEVTVMASKDNSEIPKNEMTIICSDLKQAIFLGDRSKMTLEASQEFCGKKSSL